MAERDLESLISSTLNALDVIPDIESSGALSDNSTTDVITSSAADLDECLSKIRDASPQVSGESESEDPLSKLLDGLLSENAILESMEGLALELRTFLEGKEDNEEVLRYRKQLAIYEEVSVEFKKCASVAESSSPEGIRVRSLLEELQTLGSPPAEVVEKLMTSQLSGEEDIGKEFEQFLKAASSGGNLPGLSKEDEEIIKQLTQDPNALKTLLGQSGVGQPGDCVIC